LIHAKVKNVASDRIKVERGEPRNKIKTDKKLEPAEQPKQMTYYEETAQSAKAVLLLFHSSSLCYASHSHDTNRLTSEKKMPEIDLLLCIK
jgi:hypothetical protein